MKRFEPVKNFHFHSKMLLEILLEPVVLFIVLTGNATLFIGSFLFYRLEQGVNPAVAEFQDALWWGFCTVTTVGYGDIVPHTAAGRWIGILLMVTGVFFFVSFTAIVATFLVTRSSEQTESVTRAEFQELIRALERIEKRIADGPADPSNPDVNG